MDQMMRRWVVRNRVDDWMPGNICTAMRVSSAGLATFSILCSFPPAIIDLRLERQSEMDRGFRFAQYLACTLVLVSILRAAIQVLPCLECCIQVRIAWTRATISPKLKHQKHEP